ncbi:MAG: hypothetical protein AAFQ42_05035 [Pseudomonadota bacterium]
MALFIVSPPAIEPVSVPEVRRHLKLDSVADDDLIAGLITSARQHLEMILGQAFITQQWRDVRDGWPAARTPVLLARGPLRSLDAVRVIDADGVAEVIAAENYLVDPISSPARLVCASGEAWPRPGRTLNGIEIDFTAGFGSLADDVPGPLRQALLLLVTAWYEARHPVDFTPDMSGLPTPVAGLIAPYRLRCLA